ncbi:MAG: DUF2905 family protein [Candidatus Daviesbacteria bacterium]|nr:DUF2905 family protein [Candidatus Daviesbacteria bacterium]
MDFGRIMTITALVWTLETLLFNFVTKAPFHMWGDIYIDKIGMKFYIPVLSTIVITVIITILLSMALK